jgi:hypothetical protein
MVWISGQGRGAPRKGYPLPSQAGVLNDGVNVSIFFGYVKFSGG